MLKVLLLLLLLLVIVYFTGPKVNKPSLIKTKPIVTSNLMQLEKQISESEAAIVNIKPDNEARIIWADSIPKKTPYSIVYLHGWSASQEEGDPIHVETARRYGFNLFLPRLAGHGLKEEEPLLNLTADEYLDSAEKAIAIGKQLGDKVIIMGTSTGGTLGLHFSAGDTAIAGLMLYSPNIEIFDPTAKLLSKPWGLQIAKLVTGDDYHEFDDRTKLIDQYWTSKYRLEALTQLQVLMDETMVKETFQKVTQPVFLGYYYKDEIHQDSTVSVAAMLEMFDELGTPSAKKRKVKFENVGDHVMTSYITSKDLESVRKETYSFFEEVLKVNPVFSF